MQTYNTIFYFLTGLMVGIILHRFLLSTKSAKTFSKSILPTIRALEKYSNTLTQSMNGNHSLMNELAEKRRELEKALTTRKGMYPEWIYKVGFNPGLRAGARYYLIQLERVVELLMASEFMLRERQSIRSLLSDCLEDFTIVMQGNEELISYLVNYFEAANRMPPERDYAADIKKLDQCVSEVVPGSLALLDMTTEYVDIVNLARNLKDLRQVLLNLVSSLPAQG